jgi:putative peptide zinc metalloprotease protein
MELHHKNQIDRPRLREDLKLLSGPVSTGGSSTWTLHDPVRHAFFRIGRKEFEILCLWDQPTKQILKRIDQKTTLRISGTDIDTLHKFLAANNLLSPADPIISTRLRQKACMPSKNKLTLLLSRYLFFRVPLVRPDRFLSRTLVYIRRVLPLVRCLLIPGLFLALFILVRNWSAFIHTFSYFFTVQGIFYYGMAILLAKISHELGHAYAAKHFGLHVPTMGVAFMVMWPILYTDNTEAWRVKDARPRMTIVAAGILVELFIAILATLCWAWLPEGPGRSASFILASTSWIKSLAFNVIPFLRFDGYYFLSDWLDIPNLHTRAFAFGRWYLRQGLLGTTSPPPEIVSPGRQRFLILFAYATWIYRLILFTGIALLVYHLFFKALGLILFGVEIFWFLGRPVLLELKAWPSIMDQTGFTRQNLLLMIFLILMIALVILPLGRTITVPALAKPGMSTWIYPPVAARIRAVHIKNGQEVRADQPLFEMDSPDLAHTIQLTLDRIKLLEAQIKRQMLNPILRDQGQVHHRQLAEARTALEGYRHQQNQLIIRTNRAGVIVDIPDGIHPGRWVNANQRLALLVDYRQPQIEGFVPEAVLARITLESPSRFYPDIPESPTLNLVLKNLDRTGCRFLKDPYLASVHGGPVPVIPVKDTLVVQQSLYRIILATPPDTRVPFGVIPGQLSIRVQPHSLVTDVIRRIAALSIRESGF